MDRFKSIVIICLLNCFNQIIAQNHIKYEVQNEDTVCFYYYTLNNNNDTVNKIDCNGVKSGLWVESKENDLGNDKYIGKYENNIKVGLWKLYDGDDLLKIVTYQDGVIVNVKQFGYSQKLSSDYLDSESKIIYESEILIKLIFNPNKTIKEVLVFSFKGNSDINFLNDFLNELNDKIRLIDRIEIN